MGFGQIYLWKLFGKNKSTALLKQRSLLFIKPGRSLRNLLRGVDVSVEHAGISQH